MHAELEQGGWLGGGGGLLGEVGLEEGQLGGDGGGEAGWQGGGEKAPGLRVGSLAGGEDRHRSSLLVDHVLGKVGLDQHLRAGHVQRLTVFDELRQCKL